MNKAFSPQAVQFKHPLSMSAVYAASIGKEEAESGSFSSRTELPQMVIHVEVCEAHPFTIRHLAELGMRLPMEVSGLERKDENAPDSG